jgi:hypothetical protein
VAVKASAIQAKSASSNFAVVPRSTNSSTLGYPHNCQRQGYANGSAQCKRGAPLQVNLGRGAPPGYPRSTLQTNSRIVVDRKRESVHNGIRKTNGTVAQLVRARACHARGRGFESRQSRLSSHTRFYPLRKNFYRLG